MRGGDFLHPAIMYILFSAEKPGTFFYTLMTWAELSVSLAELA